MELNQLLKGKRVGRPAPVVTLEGDEARATLPVGATASMPIADLFAQLVAGGLDTRGAVLPDGVKALVPTARGCILVHQTPPRIYNFRWIATDSEAPYGPDARYRQVRIALPYLIVLAGFDDTRSGLLQLGGRNECFFSNEPIDRQGFDTPLCFPALLNCSKFPGEDEHPLAWICTQHLMPSEYVQRETLQESLHAGMTALLRHLLESAFNLSSETHELSSWFSATVEAQVDPRIASVESWEEATRADPCFALEVPWLPTDMTLGEIIDRITRQRGGTRGDATTRSHEIARVIFHAGKKGDA